MDFFDLLKMVGGLALFLYGMNLLGDGLSQASGKCKGIFPALPVNSQLLPLVHLVFHRKIWYNKKPKCHIIPFIF